MDIIEQIFEHRQMNLDKLATFGFVRSSTESIETSWVYRTILASSGFVMTVTVTIKEEGHNTISATVVAPDINEVYTLHLAHLTGNTGGSFVGCVRAEYEQVLREIAEKCFAPDIFKMSQTKELILYVRETYGDELEFLWPKFSDNAIWRRKDTQKWYAAILTVARNKLELDRQGVSNHDKNNENNKLVEIIDLRYPPNELTTLLDGKKYFPGWHMNKKSWYTIILDGSVNTNEICDRINRSYELAIK